MKKLRLQTLTLLLLSLPGINASGTGTRTLTLDECHRLAEQNNKALRMADMNIEAARYNRKSAFTAYLPKISATGLYMHTGRELSLLSDDQKTTLSGIGDALSMPALNSVGQGLVDALRTDTRNVAAGAVMLTQPIYTGGKIKAYNNITRLAEDIAADRRDISRQDLVVDVDDTYWKIVELTSRREVAAGYLDLVNTLDGDISQMIDAGLATKADGLSVKVKVNEAHVTMIQIDNGIDLLKMRLCQLCGLEPDTSVTLADEADATPAAADADGMDPGRAAGDLRPELSALGTAARIREEQVKIARAGFLPSVALTGGYFASYPSVFNSFEKKFKGTWNIGVAVNIPVVTWGDRSYKVRAARAEATVARLELEETREKIDLQIAQCRQKVREAHERLAASESSQAEAEENLRYATLGLKEGVIPVSNVLEAQTAWMSARTGLISANIDLRLARVHLRRATGTLR